MVRTLKQEKLKSFRHSPKYMFGVRVPYGHEEAMELDKANGNTKWRDAEKLELEQVQSFDTFKSLGRGAKKPEEYKMIRV